MILVTDPSAATVTPPTRVPVVSEAPSWCALTIDPRARPVRAAREHTLASLRDDDLAADALQVVSELVTNAVSHRDEDYDPPPGATPVMLNIQIEARWVLIAVRDPWRGMPIERDAAADDVTGRGLTIVRKLAAYRWIDVDEHGGKTVYALLLRPGATLSPGELRRLRHS